MSIGLTPSELPLRSGRALRPKNENRSLRGGSCSARSPAEVDDSETNGASNEEEAKTVSVECGGDTDAIDPLDE